MFREILDAPGAELCHQRPDPVTAGEWQTRLMSLEQLICELLIENERLRMCIASAESSMGSKTDGVRRL